MKKYITLHTKLTIKECEKILQSEILVPNLRDTVIIKLNYPNFIISFNFWASNNEFYYGPPPTKFCGFLKDSNGETDIVGYFRSSYLVTFFVFLILLMSSIFLYINSGKEYPLTTFAIIACFFILTVVFSTTRKHNINRNGQPRIMSVLQTLLEIKNEKRY